MVGIALNHIARRRGARVFIVAFFYSDFKIHVLTYVESDDVAWKLRADASLTLLYGVIFVTSHV